MISPCGVMWIDPGFDPVEGGKQVATGTCLLSLLVIYQKSECGGHNDRVNQGGTQTKGKRGMGRFQNSRPFVGLSVEYRKRSRSFFFHQCKAALAASHPKRRKKGQDGRKTTNQKWSPRPLSHPASVIEVPISESAEITACSRYYPKSPMYDKL